MTETSEKTTNKIGQGRYHILKNQHRVYLPKEIAEQMEFQHCENVDVEILGPKKFLVSAKQTPSGGETDGTKKD